MATSGTYTFNPSVADLVLESFDRIGIRGPDLKAEHLQSARMSVNLELQMWPNKGINLFAVDLHDPIVLTPGVSEYLPDPETVSMLDTYIRVSYNGQENDRILTPIGRQDWANIPNKAQQGFPNSFWFERTITPKIHLWLVPDDTATYVLYFYRVRQIQDANLSGGEAPDVQLRFADALAANLTARLAEKYAPPRLAEKQALAKVAWDLAYTEDREAVNVSISPNMTGYFT